MVLPHQFCNIVQACTLIGRYHVRSTDINCAQGFRLQFPRRDFVSNSVILCHPRATGILDRSRRILQYGFNTIFCGEPQIVDEISVVSNIRVLPIEKTLSPGKATRDNR
jgi:hypothetical protein